jgi:histidinol-phosphate phosphatase family protein
VTNSTDILVALDRDGTVSRERGLINHEQRLELIPRASKAIARLNHAGIRVVIVTNQPGVGRDLISEQLLERTNRRLLELLARDNAYLDGIYVCPHIPPRHPRLSCGCHKPDTGLIQKALSDAPFSVRRIYVVGDRQNDIQLAHNVQGVGVLVLTGHGIGEWEYHRETFIPPPHAIVDDLESAVAYILHAEHLSQEAIGDTPAHANTHVETKVHMYTAPKDAFGIPNIQKQYRALQHELENRAARILGHTMGIAVNSGTAALHCAYFGVNIGSGDEVIVPNYGFFATVTPLLQLGAVPVFVDIGWDGACDADTIDALITEKTKAIVVSHLWGIPSAVKPVADLASSRGIRLIEDCSQAFASTVENTRAGSCADVATTSFNNFKAIAAGEGGLVATSNEEILHRMLLLGQGGSYAWQRMTRDHQLKPLAETGLGFKYRMHPEAVILASRGLDALEQIRTSRIAYTRAFLKAIGCVPGVEALVPQGAIEDLLPICIPLRFDDPSVAARARGSWRNHFIKAVPFEAIRPFCQYAVFQRRYPCFSYLPAQWGCSSEHSQGALAYQKQVVCFVPTPYIPCADELATFMQTSMRPDNK